MPLNPIEPGLRPPVRLRLDAVDVAKVQLVVQPGDELEVTDAIAAQLRNADPRFRTEDEIARPKGAPAPAEAPAEPEPDDKPKRRGRAQPE